MALNQARQVAGRYWLQRELGRGGMGTVWLAEDSLVRRQVALKEIRPQGAMPASELDVFSQRALAEARSAARISHPGAVEVYDVIPATDDDAAVYLVMELIQGPTLASLIAGQQRLPDATVAAYGLQVLDVLGAAHALGVIHRDIKPVNIMIADPLAPGGGQAKLTDFGIAQIAGGTRLTGTGGLVGTPAYMAPEQFSSEPATPAADLWALGATLFHAADGRSPFDRDTTAATLHAILLGDLPVPRCSPALANAIGWLLQREPGSRATIQTARAHLAQVLAGGPVPAPAPSPVASLRPAGPATAPPYAASPAPWGYPGQGDEPAGQGRRRLTPMRLAAIIAASVIVLAGAVTGVVLGTRSAPSITATKAATLDADGGDATYLSFSPDGALLGAVYRNGGYGLWKTATDRPLPVLLTDHSTAFLVFSPAGKVLAYQGNNGDTVLWNTQVYQPIGSVPGNTGFYSVSSAAFSGNGATLAVTSGQGVQLFDVATRKQVASFGSDTDNDDSVAVSPDGSLIAVASSSDNGGIELWSASSRTLIQTLPAPPAYSGTTGSWLQFSPDGKMLAIASGNPAGTEPSVQLWNVATRTLLATLTDPGSAASPASATGIAISPDSKTLAVSTSVGTVFLWDIATQKVAGTIQVDDESQVAPGEEDISVDAVAFSPDGKTLAAGDSSGNIYRYNLTFPAQGKGQ